MTNNRRCLREDIEQFENDYLSEQATQSSNDRYAHRVHPLEKCEFRTEFQRDYTRIIHCRAFRRMRHKTQVFVSPENDHLCTRLEHELHVASVASTIAQAFRLNVDLVRAMAVGHDLGHAPFGHMGERTLHKIAQEHGLFFRHELHSLRVVDYLESPYEEHHGLNLTFAVRDGIACHHGERFEPALKPERDKPVDALQTMDRGALPATLEGCVVRWADKIAYLGRDLEDAQALGMIETKDIPESVRETLGVSNREIIGSLVRELVHNGVADDSLRVSEDIHSALNELFGFNLDRIYNAIEARSPFTQVDRAMRVLFELLLDRLGGAKGDLDAIRQPEDGPCMGVLRDFLNEDVRDWQRENGARLVIDFVAGMTDPFFCRALTEMLLPRSMV